MRDTSCQPDLPYLNGLPRPARAQINATIQHGNTYLHELCRRDAPLSLVDDAVRALGADIDRLNDAGLTPLALAILHGTPVLARRLLDLGASIHVGDCNALLLAVDAKKTDMTFVLLRTGGTPAINRGGRLVNGRVSTLTPLLAAAENRHTEIYGPLIAAGALVNLPRREDGQTILHIAAAGSDTRAIPLLLAKGADPYRRAEDDWTALHVAAARDRAENVAALIAGGADIEARTRRGQTPLHIAVEFGYITCVRALLAAGADVNAQAAGIDMQTPLMMAARKGRVDIAEALLAAGADPLMTDTKHVTALSHVSRGHHAPLHERLRQEEQSALQANFEKAHRRMTANTPPRRPPPPGRR